MQVMIFFFSEKVKTLKGQGNLCIEALLVFVSLVLENTSYGPAKSKTSTKSNINIPTFFFLILEFINLFFYIIIIYEEASKKRI